MSKKSKIVLLVIIIVLLLLTAVLLFFNRNSQPADNGTSDIPEDSESSSEKIKPGKNGENKIKPAAAPSNDRNSDNEELTEAPEDTSEPIVIDPEPEPAPLTEYEEYNNMSGEQQKEFYDSFESPEDFFSWYEQAKAEYDSTRNDIILDGSTNVEIG